MSRRRATGTILSKECRLDRDIKWSTRDVMLIFPESRVAHLISRSNIRSLLDIHFPNSKSAPCTAATVRPLNSSVFIIVNDAVSHSSFPHFTQLIPPQFIYAIKPVINERWTADTETAWLTLFSIALYYMGKAMRNAAAKEVPTTSTTTTTTHRKASV